MRNKLIEYKPNELKYQTNTTKNQLVVFSEIYYDKGWNAYIDGEQVPYFRTNYTLRGMVIPAGEHKIEFRFEPASYYIGNKIMMVSSWILVLVIGFGIFKLWKESKSAEAEEI